MIKIQLTAIITLASLNTINHTERETYYGSETRESLVRFINFFEYLRYPQLAFGIRETERLRWIDDGLIER